MRNNISTIIGSLLTGSISIIGVVVGYYIANKKHIFQRTYDQKLIYISDLYKQVVDLEFEIKKYVHFIGAETTQESISKKIESLNEIKENFQKFQHKFWEIEIMLDEGSVNEINKFLKKYIEITSKLTVSTVHQQLGDLNKSFDDWNKSFELVSSDLVEIKNELKKNFRRTILKN